MTKSFKSKAGLTLASCFTLFLVSICAAFLAKKYLRQELDSKSWYKELLIWRGLLSKPLTVAMAVCWAAYGAFSALKDREVQVHEIQRLGVIAFVTLTLFAYILFLFLTS